MTYFKLSEEVVRICTYLSINGALVHQDLPVRVSWSLKVDT